MFTFILDGDLNAFLAVDSFLVWIGVGLILLFSTVRIIIWFRGGNWTTFEIDEAKLGFGDQTVTLRPNDTDRQIAYKIWVELSTRKIGLTIELDDDVISEVYDSWYSFFSVTRELIKDVPVSKFRRKHTERIIRLSIDVLNGGIRPHLTKWQARFRRWNERALDTEGHIDLSPQEVQKSFPEYDALTEDLLRVNGQLIAYRHKMYELVSRL
ncbi:MAG: hypothetical protein FVQ81_11515 [Candidatus Glassbacteria bacterium]|nr:hypothetical protein [Candidatus Glassbacteria bacterium]